MIPTLIDDFEGFKTSVTEVTGYAMEMARELKLEVEPEDVTELVQSHDNILVISCILWMRKESDFLRWQLPLLKMLCKIVEMTVRI